MKQYTLYNSRRALKSAFALLTKKGKSLKPDEKSQLQNELVQLDQATLSGNREEADTIAHRVEDFTRTRFKKSLLDYVREIVVALTLALIIAVVVRQSWFELYEIPTGSMRPTFKEQDHVAVSKTPFGINIPLTTDHVLFDPNLVQRTSIVTISSDNIPLIDQTTRFLWVFPYKKRLIKRCMGKPGDSLYFYGGKIYGVDSKGALIKEFLDSPWLEKLEHIPFMNFAGTMISPSRKETVFDQIDRPIGKLTLLAEGSTLGEVYNGRDWIKDDPLAQKTDHSEIKTYSDFWGMRNFAMTRLLTREQMLAFGDVDSYNLPITPLYLELRHTPSLTYPRPPIITNHHNALLINPYRTVIPLEQHHLDALMENMYTARFVVDNGRARRYNVEGIGFNTSSPEFPGISNGTYELYYGKAYKVGFGAITSLLPSDNPLYDRSPENVQRLYNLGIDFNTNFNPSSLYLVFYPNRYAYFREGDLYILGSPVLKKDDPALISFNEKELKREKMSSNDRPYIAFKDYGPPLNKNGEPDIDFIRTFGVTVPPEHYFLLGDNHAMSLDGRFFGFVPQENMQGAPDLILWPPGSRWGIPPQKPYPFINLPRLIVWSLAAAIALIWWLIHYRNVWKPIGIVKVRE